MVLLMNASRVAEACPFDFGQAKAAPLQGSGRVALTVSRLYRPLSRKFVQTLRRQDLDASTLGCDNS